MPEQKQDLLTPEAHDVLLCEEVQKEGNVLKEISLALTKMIDAAQDPAATMADFRDAKRELEVAVMRNALSTVIKIDLQW